MAKIKLVILDYDMTLVDSLLDFFDAINNARKYFGYPPISFKEFIDSFINDTVKDIAIPRDVDEDFFWKIFRRVYETRYGYPVKGASYFLYMLRNYGSRIVVITGREVPEEKIWCELRRFNLHWSIDEVYTLYTLELLGGKEEYLFDKTWLIRYVINKYSVEPCEAVMLGDYWIDAICSRRAGVPFIGVAIPPCRKNLLTSKGVRYIVYNLYDALQVLKEIEMEIKCK